uniref:Putative secreted protein n=1 Tax=Anopheles aquasalis TaxID=42839 RepID=T1E8B9_ANOAQ
MVRALCCCCGPLLESASATTRSVREKCGERMLSNPFHTQFRHFTPALPRTDNRSYQPTLVCCSTPLRSPSPAPLFVPVLYLENEKLVVWNSLKMILHSKWKQRNRLKSITVSSTYRHIHTY